jgi:hypothetical protein
MDQRNSDGRYAQQRTRFIWFIWFPDRTNETNKTNQTDQRNELEALGNDLPPETPHILTA